MPRSTRSGASRSTARSVPPASVLSKATRTLIGSAGEGRRATVPTASSIAGAIAPPRLLAALESGEARTILARTPTRALEPKGPGRAGRPILVDAGTLRQHWTVESRALGDPFVPVSVVIACYSDERRASLCRSIESLKAQSPVPPAIIVAVDHNPGLVAWLRQVDREVTVVENRHTRGASGSRNSGVEIATTPTVAFLDDDVVADPSWLAHLVAPLSDPGVIGTGGAVTPNWLGHRPRWFPDEFGWVIGVSPPRPPDHPVPIRNVWSENMAVRRSAFLAVGGFRVDFGKVGERSLPEDTDLCIRMQRADPQGGRFVFVPDAWAMHEVPPVRATLNFFLRRCFYEGQGKAEMSWELQGVAPLTDERDWLTRTLPSAIWREVRQGIRHGDTGSASRALAMVGGTAVAGLGAATTSVRLSAHRVLAAVRLRSAPTPRGGRSRAPGRRRSGRRRRPRARTPAG